MIERWHRTLKTSLAAKLNTANWAHELPTVLLGLRAAFKEDIGASGSAAELLCGQTLRLPREFYDEAGNIASQSIVLYEPPKRSTEEGTSTA